MLNEKVAKILNSIADYLEMEDDFFRVKAYRQAAHTVEVLTTDIETIHQEGKLIKLPGIGQHIAGKIEEIIEKGTADFYEKLKEKYPVNFEELRGVEGLGPKTIKLLYQELGIKNLDDLEREAKRHHIRRLKGMGDKKEKALLENIVFARKFRSRNLLGEVMPLAEKIKKRIEALPQSRKVEIVGSIRRRKETVGDIDVLVTTPQPQDIMDYFVSMDLVGEIIVQGPSKSTVRLKDGIECDIRVFDEEVFGAALMYFTGSKEMNVEMRKISISRGMKLSEYGLFKKEKRVAGKKEEDIFHALEMDYIPPELRENRGEVEAAQKGELPLLLKVEDIKGDLHLHSNWSDGKNTLEEMVLGAIFKGYEYVAITEHTGSLKIANGLGEEKLMQQAREIDRLNDELENITILKGAEVNIDLDGRLDIRDEVLQEMDVVVAAVHSGLNQGYFDLTRRIVTAMENENVDILAHPTGRKLQKRKESEVNLNQIFDVAQETGTLLEVNSNPVRLDLRDMNVKRALEHGCKLVVNTDAHSQNQLNNIQLGVGTARRGWAQKKDVVNTLPLKGFLKALKD
ncbi:MAG: DNA polymerase/3'-5' exonuclease PolX [Euryarchaeota archaeon]|nr:DNA polymerase/3'-5' exonuclease PolX [Euryarchaeota archaeon]MBV1729509.1 DNA polymerase/3'-5' exonuclease PolX [Methanobacterium sp.]MBV1754319.1 DNA polymerase/3'-5' exonuclease PolX [Methanobacterium sp.]